jgi:hypothetical protein
MCASVERLDANEIGRMCGIEKVNKNVGVYVVKR